MNYFDKKLREEGYTNYRLPVPNTEYHLKYWWDKSGKFWTVALYNEEGHQIEECDHAGCREHLVPLIKWRFEDNYKFENTMTGETEVINMSKKFNVVFNNYCTIHTGGTEKAYLNAVTDHLGRTEVTVYLYGIRKTLEFFTVCTSKDAPGAIEKAREIAASLNIEVAEEVNEYQRNKEGELI